MKKEDLKPGDLVYLKHDTHTGYTYFGEWNPDYSAHYPDPFVKNGEYGVFAYKPNPNDGLKQILLPYSAVQLAPKNDY